MNDIFGDPGLCEDMDREKEEANKNPVDLHITKHMVDMNDKFVTVHCAFGRVGDTFYNKPEHQVWACTKIQKLSHPKEETPNWITTIKGINVKKEPHSEQSI